MFHRVCPENRLFPPSFSGSVFSTTMAGFISVEVAVETVIKLFVILFYVIYNAQLLDIVSAT